MRGEEESLPAGQEESAMETVATDYLLVEAGGRHTAVPLADVLRIEQMPIQRIEYLGSRPVVNFEGQLLPVEDASGILAAGEGDPEAKIVVVVCREGSRQVGIAVSHVLDVAAGDRLFEAGSHRLTDGVTQLKQRVTGIIDLGTVPPLPALEESADNTQLLAEELA